MAYRNSRRYSSSRGQEIAREHIREAEEFSREIGGTDKDVKSYFFNLSSTELENIFTLYGSRYGSEKESYARVAFSRWKQGSTRMSGLVAKRIFDLLPPLMPLKEKYKLAENIWNHFGPSSTHSYVISPQSNLEKLINTISETLQSNVTSYSIPENVKNRFKWLAAGDVELQEKLLIHFREQEKQLIVTKVSCEIPVLQKQAREHSTTTSHIRSVLNIYKHTITIWVDPNSEGEVREGSLALKSNTDDDTSFSWGWIIFIAIVLVYFFSAAK